MTELKRIVIDLRQKEMVLRVLYHSKADTNPGTVRRRREVTDLVRGGLQDALEQLQGDVEVVGTSGFTTREDVLCISRREHVAEDVHKKRKKGA